MRIDPISGYSGSQSYIRSLNYSVGAARPVMYADSQVTSMGPRKGSSKAREIEQAFNKIASDHYGETVSYGPKGQGFGYEAEGRIFDVFT